MPLMILAGFRFLVLVIATCRIVIMGIYDKLNIVTAYIADELMRIMHVQAIDLVKDHIVHTTIYCKLRSRATAGT